MIIHSHLTSCMPDRPPGRTVETDSGHLDRYCPIPFLSPCEGAAAAPAAGGSLFWALEHGTNHDDPSAFPQDRAGASSLNSQGFET